MSRRFLPVAFVSIVSMLLTFLPSTGFPGTFVAFGPQSHTRGTGSPVTVTNAFTVLNPNTTYALQIYNGGLTDGEFEKVSSSVISINGVQVVGPNEFNQNVALIERPVTLATSNQLSVELRGKPGGGITVQIIGVDNDPPTITAAVNPAPNAAGWHKSNATVSFTCGDGLSGVASCPAPVTVNAEGVNQLVSGTATDRAGNSASASVFISLDKTAPTVAINSPANGSSFTSSPVRATGTAMDGLSGIATVLCNGSPASLSASAFSCDVSLTDGPNTITVEATDVAGNTGSSSITVNRQPQAAVTVLPEQVDLTVNQTQQFTATVSVTTDQRVTWSVSGGGGKFSPGSINATGLYTAPKSPPAPPFVMVKAISVADPSASGTAQVIVRGIADFGNRNADNDLLGINYGLYLQFTWVDLPEGTTKIVFSRSPNSNGPWTEVKISENPSTLTPEKSVVYTEADQVPPDTATDYFYKLEAFSATEQLLKSYAPLFIPKVVEPIY